VSIGGTIAALVGAIYPLAGSAVSLLLFYPTQLLIWIVDFFNNLPGTSFAVGQINVWQLLALYMLILGGWKYPKWHRQWYTPTVIGLIIIIVPLLFGKVNEFQITILASNDRQLFVLQDRGQTTLFNSGNESIVRYTIMPFFQQQAINQIDIAIDLKSNPSIQNDWQAVKQFLPIKTAYGIGEKSIEMGNTKFQPFPNNAVKQIGRASIKPLQTNPTILQIELPEFKQKWTIIGDEKVGDTPQIIDVDRLTPVQTLYWGGGKLSKESIVAMSPQIAIAASINPDPDTMILLEQNNVRVYYTGRDGAIQWTPTGEFKPYLEGERFQ
jgi:competence protein ComEC